MSRRYATITSSGKNTNVAAPSHTCTKQATKGWAGGGVGGRLAVLEKWRRAGVALCGAGVLKACLDEVGGDDLQHDHQPGARGGAAGPLDKRRMAAVAPRRVARGGAAAAPRVRKERGEGGARVDSEVLLATQQPEVPILGRW